MENDFGHDEDEAVALHGAHHGQADAGVPGGGLDDDRVRLQHPASLGVLDHGQGDAVLDRSTRVATLELDPDLDAGVEEAMDADVGCVADGVEDGVEGHGLAPCCG